MKNATFINYQGGKNNIIEFILDSIDSLELNDGKILDIFSGSGAVTSSLLSKYKVISNDAELYACIISKAMSASHELNLINKNNLNHQISEFYNEILESEDLASVVKLEAESLKKKDKESISEIYKNFKTVWNCPDRFNPRNMREAKRYNLFTRYYAGSYFGIKQAIEIDAIIKTIHVENKELYEVLYSCLFYAMKETVYSRDGHMAQPLSFTNNATRGFNTRIKSVRDFFIRKLDELIEAYDPNASFKQHQVYNKTLDKLLLNEPLMQDVDVIYADPPYTDMQYSRYYHLLNVAANYNYPNLTKTSKGFTKGLYTEGRFQSPLSQKGGAKSQLLKLIQVSKLHDKTLIFSYAYPRDVEEQQTTRYTVSIKELIEMCSEYFGANNVKVKKKDYSHANHRNSKAKLVVEYLIICKGKPDKHNNIIDISEVKKNISKISPTNRSPVYNTHLYWSQKAFNITDYLITHLTEKDDLIFDPFLGSGVTVLEAVKTGADRKAVGCDINEMPLFITETILTDATNTKAIDDLKDLSHKIEDFQELYNVRCDKCKSINQTDKVVFDKPARNSNDIKISQINIKCDCGNKVILDEIVFSEVNECMYAEYNFKHIDADFPLLKNSKVAVLEGDVIANIFTCRNLKALDIILELSKDYESSSQNLIKYIINSMLHQCKITDLRSNSQWPLWIPKKDCVEKNVFALMRRKISKFLLAQKTIRSLYAQSGLVSNYNDLTRNKALLLRKGSQYITNQELPSNCVDLIITDPPYLEQVLYSEYMQLYKPIVGLDYNLEDEIIVSSAKGRNKTKDIYYQSLEDVFLLCGEKLKPNKLLCLYFHDSSLDVWDRLVDMLYRAGFEFIGQTHIKKNRTLKNIISPKKSLNGDSILFFNNKKEPISCLKGQECIETIETNIINEARHMIRTNGALSTPELYDNGLMTILIHNGWLKTISKHHKSLVEIFEKNLSWDAKIAKWFIEK